MLAQIRTDESRAKVVNRQQASHSRRLYTIFMQDLGRILIGLGALLLLIGALVLLLGRSGLPLGRLPGDIVYRGKNVTLSFPLATCLALSVVLSLALYVLNRFRR